VGVALSGGDGGDVTRRLATANLPFLRKPYRLEMRRQAIDTPPPVIRQALDVEGWRALPLRLGDAVCMTTVLLIINLFVTIALIGVVLIQRSEGGGLGIGGSQGMGAFMSGRGTANLLTRATAILATIFMGLSLLLALMNRGTSGVGGHSILDLGNGPVAPISAPSPGKTPATSSPGSPSVPASGSPAPSGAGTSAPGSAAPPAPTGPSIPTK